MAAAKQPAFALAMRDPGVMKTTPRPIIDSVVRSTYGHRVAGLVRLTGAGLNEAYRVDVVGGRPVVIRIARRPVPWFTDEKHIMARAQAVGVPTPEVLGVEHLEHDGELLSFSILRLLPGRPLDERSVDLSTADLERLVVDGGELMAQLHSLEADGGIGHKLEPPDDRLVNRAVGVAHETFGSAAAAIVERGIDLLRDEVMARPTPPTSLAHGDFLPKHLLIDDGMISGVIDWELAGSASPAFDLAHWQVAACNDLNDRSDLVRRGYARVADPDLADGGWVPAYAIDFALDVLSWKNPAPTLRLQRCVDVIAHHIGAEPIGAA